MAQHHATQKSVIVRSTPEGPIQKEWLMDAACLPGMAVEYASSTRIQVLSATLDPTLRVVVESGTIPSDGTYASGDQMPFIVPQRGDEVMVYATAAALSTLAVGNELVSDGNGFLIYAASPIVGEAMAVVMEAATIAADPGLTQVIVEVL